MSTNYVTAKLREHDVTESRTRNLYASKGELIKREERQSLSPLPASAYFAVPGDVKFMRGE